MSSLSSIPDSLSPVKPISRSSFGGPKLSNTVETTLQEERYEDSFLLPLRSSTKNTYLGLSKANKRRSVSCLTENHEASIFDKTQIPSTQCYSGKASSINTETKEKSFTITKKRCRKNSIFRTCCDESRQNPFGLKKTDLKTLHDFNVETYKAKYGSSTFNLIEVIKGIRQNALLKAPLQAIKDKVKKQLQPALAFQYSKLPKKNVLMSLNVKAQQNLAQRQIKKMNSTLRSNSVGIYVVHSK